MEHTDPLREHELMTTRRQLFGRTALGLGTAAMANLLGPDLLAEGVLPWEPITPQRPSV